LRFVGASVFVYRALGGRRFEGRARAVPESVYRFSRGDDPRSVLGEALSDARALQDLKGPAEKGVKTIVLRTRWL
jgi:hypothetical protein